MPLIPCGRVVIDEEKCDLCRRCVEYCPVEALEVRGGRVVQRGVCIVCGGCVAVCENRAVRVEPGRCNVEGVAVKS